MRLPRFRFSRLSRAVSSLSLFALTLSIGALSAEAFRAAPSGLRTIAVPESSIEIRIWEERNVDGTTQSFYALTRLGEGALGRTRQTSNEVQLASVRFDPLIGGPPQVAASLEARPDNRLFLVQLFATALPEFQAGIAARGGIIHRYYTEHTLLVEMGPAELSEIETLPFVRWVGDYHPSFRVENVLRDALASNADLDEARYSIMLTRRGAAAQEEFAFRIRDLGGKIEVL
ncbi:MAG: peptidase S8, partial [Acidobacteria bacterium]|nr:peptidase S8 [Acidobacteriota bacterium]